MLIKTKYIDCASKSVFNTWKLPTSAADTSGDIYWSAVVYIKDTGEVWTHGKLYGGFFSNADSNKVSLTIGGTTKILALDGHVQSYTTLTGSGTTADQAILSTGVANKWTLKTLGKNAFSNVDYLPADATAVAAEKVVNAMRFQYNGKDMHSFDGSAARLLNIIQGDNVFITGDSQGNVTIAADPGSNTVNTAGATNLIDKKLFLIGAESQTTSPQTYSNQYVYIGTDNCLYSLGKKVLTEHQAIYNLDLQTQVGGAVTKVTTFDPNAANNSFTLVQGTNVTLIPNATNKKVTISSKDTTYDFYNLIFKQRDTVVDTYKPTTSPNKSFKAGTNVTFTKSGDEITVTTQDTRNTAGATEKLATKLFLTGSLTQTNNPQTYTNSKVYIGADNKLYSDGKVVSTRDHTHNYAGATTPGGPALKVDLNPSGLLDATYGSYGGILQDSNNGPATGSWSNRIKILHNNSSGYYTELAQAMTGTAGLWHRRNVAGVVSDWTPVIDKANFRTYLDATYVIRGNDPNVLTNYVRYSIASGLTMNWEAGNATPTHVWGAKNGDSSKAYVFNGGNIRAFANAVNRAGDTMTGTLKVTEIQTTGGSGLTMYSGTNWTYLGQQAGTTYIRSGKTDLQHRYNGTDYKIWDARNLVGLRTEHSHNTINHIDSRGVASTPQEHGAGVWLDFKANAKANLTDGGNYTGLLTVRKYGGTTDWTGGKSAQLGFTDNSNVWVRFGTGTSWEAWKQLATTGWADGKFLPLAGGKMTSGARISHDGNLYIGNSDNAGWVALQDICSQNSIGDGVWSIRTNGNAIFTTIKKVGSSDSYVLLGGGGHKALNQFIYSTYGSYGVNERTGNSDDLGRAGFWRDNNLGAYGVTLMHSDSANYQCKIYHDYGTGGNLYMKSRADGTWGNIYTIWNSGNFNPNTKVNKAGDTMTGALKVMNILLQNNEEINCETNTLFLQYRGSKGIRLCNNNQPLTYGSSNYTIYHTGNLSLDNYVKKTGDTMTGNLQVGQVVIGNTSEVNATDSGNVLYLGYRNTPGGVNICYNNAPLTYGSAKYTIYHSGNISSVLNKRRVPGEVVDFYVYQVNGYTCTSTDYTTFRNQLFDSSGRGKSSVSYKATSSSMTYTVNLSDFVLAYNGIRAYSNGMYTAGGGEIESNRIGSTAGANSKTITGYEMPKHAHWFGHYRSDNANDRDVFGPDGGQNHSTNGTTSAGQGGNWRTGYSGNGQSKDWRPKTIFVFKMVYAPQSW